MRKLKAGAALVAAAGLSLLLPTPANAIPGYANHASATDPSADTAASEDDITNLYLGFDMSTIYVATTTTSGLPVRTDPSWSHNDGAGRAYEVDLQLNNEPAATAAIFVDGDVAKVYDLGDGSELCDLGTLSISGTSLVTSFPASCLGTPGKVSITATLGDVTSNDPNDVDVAVANGGADPTPVEAQAAGGYWQLGADGGVYSFGDASFYGSTGNLHLAAPVVGMSAKPDASGYRFVASDGGVFAYHAGFYGSMGGSHLNAPVVGMATTDTGNGYWLVASDGGVFAYGDAVFYGSMGGQPLNRPIVGIAAAPDGHGYWLVASDGGIFAYGSAQFKGSTGSMHLNRDIVGMASSGTVGGYYMVASDGGVFCYGDATFHGSGVGAFDSDVVGITSEGTAGYRLTTEGGDVQSYGVLYDHSDIARYGVVPNAPIVGIAG